MEKTRNELINDKAKRFYADSIKIIGDMYDEVFAKNDAFAYTRVELFADYDAYLQAVLLKICYEHGKFGKDEMNFIESITDYGKLLEGTDFNLFADCVSDMREKLVEKANERIGEVPLCFKLSGAVDSGRNTGVTKAILDDVIRIVFNLKLLDENADIKNNGDILAALKTVYVFMSANGIAV
ncbi:MAG: hypothetical protein J5903_02960 [Clostridia bacterium]|nr:hypothetical protein [Clostridia bacterium]